MKVSVVGLGKVGSSLAFVLAIKNFVQELVLVGRTRESVLGDVLDLRGLTDVTVTYTNPDPITGTSEVARMRRHTSRPSRSGSIRSRMTRSGGGLPVTLSRPLWPLGACAT